MMPTKYTVQTGLEVLLEQQRPRFSGRRIGLLANPTAVNNQLVHAADLFDLAGLDLRCLFGPEHGVRGEAQDMISVETALDPRLKIPVYSLYSAREASLRPAPEMLEDLDLLVFDIQDIGSRYYTYIWTMVLTMEACAEAGVTMVILDRPNPIDGLHLEGPGIQAGFESFVGLHSVPNRHGMTPGEIALLTRRERGIDLELEVIGLQGWKRDCLHDQLTTPWVLPSPNMPTLETALVYPGGCLLEGTNISEGRGTTRPFEILGAPWVDGGILAADLEQEDLPGVRFRPLGFSPSFHKHRATRCGGIQLHIANRQLFRPLRTGVAILRNIKHRWPEEFCWRREAYEFVADRPAIDLLAGGSWLRQGIDAGATLHDLMTGWKEHEAEFEERRRPFLLYQ